MYNDVLLLDKSGTYPVTTVCWCAAGMTRVLVCERTTCHCAFPSMPRRRPRKNICFSPPLCDGNFCSAGIGWPAVDLPCRSDQPLPFPVAVPQRFTVSTGFLGDTRQAIRSSEDAFDGYLPLDAMAQPHPYHKFIRLLARMSWMGRGARAAFMFLMVVPAKTGTDASLHFLHSLLNV